MGENFQVNTLVPDRADLSIGVFDSGVGGLTVAAALRRRLPDEDLLYLGDTARLPYGTKSPETVVRYGLRAAAFMVAQGVKMLVVACNTASAHALGAVAAAYPELPVLGVVEPGAEAAARASVSGRIVVAATEGTCRSGAFDRAIAAHRPDARVISVPCPLFVALAEESLTEGPIAEAIAAHYLNGLFPPVGGSDCMVLGCTHFPLLADTLRRVIGVGPVLIDCAEAVAEQAALALAAAGCPAPRGRRGSIRLMTTDAPDRFAHAADRMFPGFSLAAPVLVDI